MCGHHAHARAYAASHAGCCGPTPNPGEECCEGAPHHHGEGCCDHVPGLRFHRRLMGRGERIARLEAYLADLRAEAQAVEEELARLRKSE